MHWNENIALFGFAVGAMATLVGGWDTLIKCLLLLMIMDLGAGLLACVVFGKSKYTLGGISSDVLLKGTVRKVSMLGVVCLGVIVDKVMEFDYIRNVVVTYFIATEGLSVIEHIAVMGVPLPTFLVNLLEVMRDKSDGGNDNGQDDKSNNDQ